MNKFQSFFYALLGYMVTNVFFVRYFMPADWVHYLNVIPSILLIYGLLSPFFLLKHYRERTWLALLTLPHAAFLLLWLCWSLGLRALVSLRVTAQAFASITMDISISITVGALLFVIACFCVRAPSVRRKFRLQGSFTITTFLITVGWNYLLNYGAGSNMPHRLHYVFLNVVIVAGNIPLAMLNYEAWRKPEEDALTTAVAALGSDQVPG
jgi:hypothetical protein